MNMYVEIQELVNDGVSLIPVNTKTKAPYLKAWKNQPKVEFFDLIDLMDNKFSTSSVAMVLGTPSDRLVCIDVDTKYKLGFDTTLFFDLREIYPDIYDILRVEKTPSGGFHILYRVEDGFDLPGNIKCASRELTEAEKLQNEVEQKKEKSKCFLEIKCEGGLAQCFPSPGYTVVKDNSIPTLSKEEHHSLMNLCTSYNEIVKKDAIKVERHVSELYDENPFEHFNKSNEGSKILDEEGWTIYKTHGGRTYYQHPGKKDLNHGSAAYSESKSLYTIFTAGTSLEPKSYSPSNLLAELKFNGDKKELFAYLIAKGYGKIKPRREKEIIRRCVHDDTPLPQNISEEGKVEYQTQKEEFNSNYPFGVFWMENDLGGYSISRELIYKVAEGLGFRIHMGQACKIEGFVIEVIEERDFFDRIKSYIRKEETRYIDICDCYEAFLQKSGKFTITRLPVLDTTNLFKSSKEESFKFFRNGYVHITKDVLELNPYENIDKLVWKHLIQDRDFVKNDKIEDSLYYKFLNLCLGSVSDHAYRCIGYYAHEYKSTMMAYIVVLCEMNENPNDGGGSGKNIFTNLMRFTTTLLNKPGKNVKFDDTMLRTWRGEKILSLNDIDKKFDFLGLRELSTGEGEVGKKFVQEVTIKNEDMPKFIVNTNYSFDPSGPGLKRRLVPLEFTDFFSKVGGVDVHFGKDFPIDKTSHHDWSENDWIGYDNMIAKSIQKFIENNCKLTIPKLTSTGWIKQFEERFGIMTHNFIKEYMQSWLDLENVRINEVFNLNYEAFVKENNVNKQYHVSSQKMNDALQNYCEQYGIEFIKSKNTKINTIQCNAKVFKKIGSEPKVVDDPNSFDDYDNYHSDDDKTTEIAPF